MKHISSTQSQIPHRLAGLLANRDLRRAGLMLGMLLLLELVLQAGLTLGWNIDRRLDSVGAVAIDAQDRAWIAGQIGNGPALVMIPNDGRVGQPGLPAELAAAELKSLAIDHQGRVWVGSMEGLVGRRDVNGGWTLYRAVSPTSENPIWDLVADGDGRIWVRSHHGPGRIDLGSNSRSFSLSSYGPAEQGAAALAIDSEGRLWVLTRKRELYIHQPDDAWKFHATAPESIAMTPLGSALAVDPDGQAWIATHGGVAVLSRAGDWREHPLGDPGSVLAIKAIKLDSRGRVWVASEFQGLFRFDPQDGWVHYHHRNSGLPAALLTSLAIDSQGRIWIGSSRDGVSRFDPDRALPAGMLRVVELMALVLIPAGLLGVVLFAAWALVSDHFGALTPKRIGVFSSGLAIWFILNTVLWGFIRLSHEQSGGMLFINPLVCLAPPINLILLVVLVRFNRGIAFGSVAAFILNWIGLILRITASAAQNESAIVNAVFMVPFFMP